MLSSNKVKFIKSLQQKKFRDEHKLFVAETPKIVQDLLESDLNIREIFSTADWLATFSEAAENIVINEVTAAELQRISGLVTSNQVLALVEIPENRIDISALFNDLSLVLDDIRDPGNLGTIIRIADWFGIKNVICSKTSVEAYNPKVVQSTMGSIARVNIYYEDMAGICKHKPADFPVYGTFLEGDNIFTTKLQHRGFIVIGNEANGIGEDMQTCITHKLTIPSFSANKKSAESLNAAIATAIVCAEFRK